MWRNQSSRSQNLREVLKSVRSSSFFNASTVTCRTRPVRSTVVADNSSLVIVVHALLKMCWRLPWECNHCFLVKSDSCYVWHGTHQIGRLQLFLSFTYSRNNLQDHEGSQPQKIVGIQKIIMTTMTTSPNNRITITFLIIHRILCYTCNRKSPCAWS